MRKSIKINLIARSLAILASCVLMPNVLRAEKYQILAFKNCSPTVDNKAVGLNTIFSDSQKLAPNWKTNGKGSKYIKLQNIADGSVKVIAEPQKKKSTTQKEEGFISFLLNSLTGQKKCSTRIVDNELFNVLTDDLSQTFYILMEKNQRNQLL